VGMGWVWGLKSNSFRAIAKFLDNQQRTTKISAYLLSENGIIPYSEIKCPKSTPHVFLIIGRRLAESDKAILNETV